MFCRTKVLLVAVTVIFVFQCPATGAENKIMGEVSGRSGEVLYVRLPHPVRDGSTLEIKTITTQPPIAIARVLSCTPERPFIALAKVERGDLGQTVPIGARAYVGVKSVSGADVPKPLAKPGPPDTDRFSVQAGAFYPRTPVLRDTVADFWEAYRLNYSFLKMGNFDAMLSAEYMKGFGEFSSSDRTVERRQEILPLSAIARIKPLRFGSTSLFIGAGGGIYLLRSRERIGDSSTETRSHEFGRELVTGLESRRGWVAEFRYRDVPDTDIQGYSLTVGQRF